MKQSGLKINRGFLEAFFVFGILILWGLFPLAALILIPIILFFSINKETVVEFVFGYTLVMGWIYFILWLGGKIF